MIIYRSIDIEDEIRKAIGDYVTAYVRPLPDNFDVPSVLVELMGGTTNNTIDSFLVRLSARAKTDAEALEILRTALGVLDHQSKEQTGGIRYSAENNLMSWGNDPIRPDLKLCSATVTALAHKESVEISDS